MFTIEPRNVSIFEHRTQSSYKHMFFWSLILDSYRNTQRSNIGVWNIYTLDLISTSALCGVGIKQCSPEVAIFLVDLIRILALKTLNFSFPNH